MEGRHLGIENEVRHRQITMDADAQREISLLQKRLDACERQLQKLERIEIAQESGGGQAVYGASGVTLRLNALTPNSVQTS